MKKTALLMMLLLTLATACSSSEDKSKELFQTAQLEENQNNIEHAKQLYKEIVTKYPKSKLAKQAQERLDSL
ncbi:lipoprotein [Geoanaerobacter pelophilus]|uniref:Lipoprotein n=1 Tax=Geoanaerobacter pelophilus TaxID=60036 RepID=A0ABQ0MFB5_9BACT|nr:tetratricopeptide repeat protein [Geoanaerobacter pelophilus]GAW65795.1 lipoprotein [Geoanaerobacter pelophilus]